MTGEVVAELNDHVREDMMEALPPEAVADIAEQLDTDDAVQLIEDLDAEGPGGRPRRDGARGTARRSRPRCPIPRRARGA
jgi:hypothetical protein